MRMVLNLIGMMFLELFMPSAKEEIAWYFMEDKICIAVK
jgi:hypothetical protein